MYELMLYMVLNILYRILEGFHEQNLFNIKSLLVGKKKTFPKLPKNLSASSSARPSANYIVWGLFCLPAAPGEF